MSATALQVVDSDLNRPPSMVERMTLIIDCFEGANSYLLLEDVSRQTGLPRSTAHRILVQLIRLQWVEHTRAGYRLGRRVMRWGIRESAHTDLRAAAASVLHTLAEQTGLVVHLAVLDGREVEYLDKIGRRAALVASRVGGRALAHRTALGLAMLAQLQPEEVDDLYAECTSFGDERELSLERLHTELIRIRRNRGVASERGLCVAGVACVGAAVRGPEGPVGAISLVGDEKTSLDRLAPLVLNAATVVSRELFRDPEGGLRGLERHASAG